VVEREVSTTSLAMIIVIIHWLKDPDDAYSVVRSASTRGNLMPLDPGWASQILYERGWINPAVKGKGKETFNLV